MSEHLPNIFIATCFLGNGEEIPRDYFQRRQRDAGNPLWRTVFSLLLQIVFTFYSYLFACFELLTSIFPIYVKVLTQKLGRM